MKINAAKFSNFARFEKFECKFADTVTHLIGANGAGKTTVGLKGLMACINGISEQDGKGQLAGERFRFIGKAGKSADISYQFLDESNGSTFWIKNHVTASGNNITFKNDGDNPINEEWLKGFLNIALMSAKNFCSLSGREQAIALGIDTSSFDAEIKKYKEEFTGLNRDLKNMGEITAVEKVEPVSLADLAAKKEKIRTELNALYTKNKKHNHEMREKFNACIEAEKKAIREFNDLQEDKELFLQKVNDYLQGLIQCGYGGHEVAGWVSELPKPLAQKDENDLATLEPSYIMEMPDDAGLREVDSQILSAMKTNMAADKYQENVAAIAKKEAKKKEIADNKSKQEEASRARNSYIASFKFPFAGLATDENGCLLLNDRPINDSYFSKGELEMIVARLHASLNPVFKVRFIDDFDLLDEKNQEKLLQDLLAAGFQIITAEVGEKSDKENCIVLRECKLATEDEGKEKLI